MPSSDYSADVPVLPAEGQHTATAIFLHGLSESGAEMLPWAKRMKLPHVKFVCPTAPEKWVTLMGGDLIPAWANIIGIYDGVDEVEGEDEDGYMETVSIIEDIVKGEVDAGIPASRIILVGFSLGGAAVLNCLTKMKSRIGGALVLNGWLPLTHAPSWMYTKTNKGAPTLMLNASHNPVIPAPRAEKGCKKLLELGYTAEIRTYDSHDHAPTDEMFEDARSFLSQAVPV